MQKRTTLGGLAPVDSWRRRRLGIGLGIGLQLLAACGGDWPLVDDAGATGKADGLRRDQADAAPLDEGAQQRANAEVQQLADALLPEVSAATGLVALRPVRAVQVDRSGMRAMLARDMVAQNAAAQQAQGDTQLAQVSAPALSAEEVAYLDHMQDKVLGLYDPDTKQLVVAQRLTAEGRALTMRHELTHALQDQHFSLMQLHAAAEQSVDAALALTSVLEGQAMVAMQAQGVVAEEAEEAVPAPWTPSEGLYALLAARRTLVKLTPEPTAGEEESLAVYVLRAAARTDRLGGATMPQRASEVSSDEMARLVFPYTYGKYFIETLCKQQPLPAVIQQTLQQVPTSSHEIIHPDAYLAKDAPVDLLLPALRQLPNHPVRWENTLGEFTTRLTLGGGRLAAQVAAGWRGDRILLLDGFGKQPATVWVSAWRSPAAAARFGRAVVATLPSRGANQSAPAGWRVGRDRSQVFRLGQLLAIVDDVPAAALPQVRQALEEDLAQLVAP